MSQRHNNALGIVNPGACNPSGIAHAIVEACAEIRAERNYSGTRMLSRDPALRLMVHQLSCLVGNGEMDLDDYNDCYDECERQVVQDQQRAEVVS
jgi:hypothetical protein